MGDCKLCLIYEPRLAKCLSCDVMICNVCVKYGQKIGMFSEDNGYYICCSYKCAEDTLDTFMNDPCYFDEIIDYSHHSIFTTLIHDVQKRELNEIFHINVSKLLYEMKFIVDISKIIGEYIVDYIDNFF